MSTNGIAKTFDYASVPEDQRSVVQQKTSEIRDRFGRAAQNVYEIGTRLADVKANIGHGMFAKWIEAEFQMPQRTAQAMMSVARTFKSATVAHLDIAPGVLYMLASPSTPDEVRGEIVERARGGEKITKEIVKVAVKRATPPITPNDDDIPDEDPIAPEPEPVIEPVPVDPREAYNAAVTAAIAHLELDAKAIALAGGAENGKQGARKLTNPAVASLVTWTGTIGLLRDTAEGLRGNLVVPHPSKAGEYVTATAAHRLKAVAAK